MTTITTITQQFEHLFDIELISRKSALKDVKITNRPIENDPSKLAGFLEVFIGKNHRNCICLRQQDSDASMERLT